MKALGALRRGLASLKTSQSGSSERRRARPYGGGQPMERTRLGERVYCHEFNDSSNDKKHDRRHPTVNPIPEHVVPFDCDRARAGRRRAIDLM